MEHVPALRHLGKHQALTRTRREMSAPLWRDSPAGDKLTEVNRFPYTRNKIPGNGNEGNILFPTWAKPVRHIEKISRTKYKVRGGKIVLFQVR